MNKKINQISDELTLILKEVLETTEENAKEIVFKYLNKESGIFDYKTFQEIQKPRIKEELQLAIKDAIGKLNTAVENTKTVVEYNTEKIQKEIFSKTNGLVLASIREYNLGVSRVLRLEKIIPLKEAIFKQTQEGIDKGIKIRTKRGNMGYKEYMEMAVRTTIQNEIGEQQLKFNVDAKVVFYISNVFQDSADDHADYQGKYYYDERYKSYGFTTDLLTEIQNRINQLSMLSVQEVRDGEPYLTTRPNCRHRLTPISIKKVLNNLPDEIIADMRLSDGTYKDKNYMLSQEQRKNERMIRKYKARKEHNIKLYEQTANELYNEQSKKDNLLLRQWQQKQIRLVKANPQLDRDYRRETKNIVLNDLGAKYNQPIL